MRGGGVGYVGDGGRLTVLARCDTLASGHSIATTGEGESGRGVAGAQDSQVRAGEMFAWEVVDVL